MCKILCSKDVQIVAGTIVVGVRAAFTRQCNFSVDLHLQHCKMKCYLDVV